MGLFCVAISLNYWNDAPAYLTRAICRRSRLVGTVTEKGMNGVIAFSDASARVLSHGDVGVGPTLCH
ncbi:MAG: hypothetical protein GPOALKHO_001431 [Sodalis sp.]|nr:MAG: hypothetical protein GPOALKHO_001431 [Sodalis sp.]